MASPLKNLENELGRKLEEFEIRGNYEYQSVSVLLLSWKDDNLGVQSEIREMRDMFRKVFNYDVQEFLIPSDNPELSLASEVASFVQRFGTDGSLLVIYYGGHGDPDIRGDQQAVWAANIQQGQTLRWYLIQPSLSLSRGDVLLLLDCCFAGQAARAGLGQKFELLAAASMNLMTPGPRGPYKSFTAALLEVMPNLAREPHGFLISRLQEEMVKKEVGLKQQSFHTAIAGASNGSIRLRPLTGMIVPPNQSKDSFADLSVRISMPQEPSLHDIELLVRWLTANRPPNILSLHLENVIWKAKAQMKIGQCCIDVTAADRMKSGTRERATSAQVDIQARLDSLKKGLCLPPDASITTSENVAHTLDSLQRQGETLCDALEDSLSEFDSKLLQKLLTMPELSTTDLETSVSLRLLLTDQLPAASGEITGEVKFGQAPRKADQRWCRGAWRDLETLVEYWYFGSGDVSQSDRAAVRKQADRTTTMLRRIRQSAFSTLEVCGYTSELAQGPRYGIVYRIPQQHLGRQAYTLYDLLKDTPLVPLETRFKLAWNLSQSLLRFHAIGWLHKEIKSSNIILFGKPKGSSTRLKWFDITLTDAYLCGFDFSRPEAAESDLRTDFGLERNLYRHPERWGRPKRFLQKHDIYALGLLLLEIGTWNRLSNMDPDRAGFKNISDPEEIRSTILNRVEDNLAHRAGMPYARVVRSCLVFESHDTVLGANPEGLKFFRRNIVGTLGRLCEGFET